MRSKTSERGFVGAKLPADMLERVRQLAIASDRSVSATVRLALRKLIEEDRKKN